MTITQNKKFPYIYEIDNKTVGCLPTQQNICEYLTSHPSQDMEVQVVVSSQAKAMVSTFYLFFTDASPLNKSEVGSRKYSFVTGI